MNSVSVGFELILTEIEAEEELLNLEGSNSFHESDYDKGEVLIKKGRKLLIFRNEIDDLKTEWERDFGQSFPDEVIPDNIAEAQRSILSATKSSKSSLLVRFPDGSTLSYEKASETFAETLKRIGFASVIALDMKVNKEDLVSKTASKKYNDTKIDHFFVKTHSSTSAKKRQLDEISKRLNYGLRVTILPPKD